jgi:hypothetical protein
MQTIIGQVRVRLIVRGCRISKRWFLYLMSGPSLLGRNCGFLESAEQGLANE